MLDRFQIFHSICAWCVQRKLTSEHTVYKFSTANFGKVDRRRKNHLVGWWRKLLLLIQVLVEVGVDGLGVGGVVQQLCTMFLGQPTVFTEALA